MGRTVNGLFPLTAKGFARALVERAMPFRPTHVTMISLIWSTIQSKARDPIHIFLSLLSLEIGSIIVVSLR